jgi:two-component system sensor histidine kinase GlrK
MIKPRSILQLTLTGFIAISCLLFIALFLAGRQVRTLGSNSQTILSQAVRGLEYVRVISEQAGDMERNARQFLVTRDRNLAAVYTERRQAFLEAIDQLRQLDGDPIQQQLLQQLSETEATNHNVITAMAEGIAAPRNYTSILEPSRRIGDYQGMQALSRLETINRETETMQAFLRMQTILLVTAALGFATLFTILITRPLLQLQKAINQLGSGAFTEPVSVTGPTDLVNLGHSLDWLRSRLQKLEKQRSSFFRHISHEFKTPLAAIRESGSLLRDEVTGTLNSRQLRLLDIQAGNCQKLQTLIDQLLRFQTEIQIGLNNMPQTLRLDRIIDEVLADHQYGIETGNITINRETVPVEISGDAEQLRVIIDNLLSNAIRYSPNGGTILLRLFIEDEQAVLDVIDQGPGVPVEEQEKIFDAFFQGANRPLARTPGNGLGLAIVREYLDMNKGRICLLPAPSGAHFRVNIEL